MVTVANCYDIHEAFRLQMALGAADIPSLIPDEATAQNAPYFFFGSGQGVRLQVAEEHASEAQRIISQAREEFRNQDEEQEPPPLDPVASLPHMATRDNALLACRVGFFVTVVFVTFAWSQMTADQRFYVILFAILAWIILASSGSFHVLCSKLVYFGWIVVGFALFTLLTGYRIGWKTVRVVENTSGIPPLIAGLLVVLISFCAKRFIRNG